MSEPFDDLIITDTSPLITMALADHLHALTAPGIRIVIADLVASGATDFASLHAIAGKLLPRSHPNRILLDDLAA